jgi:hypothetical protein
VTWTIEQQAEHRRLLVEALRSGDYTQCSSQLTRLPDPDTGHPYEEDCCLGVACKVARINGLELRTDDIGQTVYYRDETSGWEADILPDSVRYFYGFASSNGSLHQAVPIGQYLLAKHKLSDKLAHSLVDLNDSGFSFDEIASEIEAGNVVLTTDGLTEDD